LDSPLIAIAHIGEFDALELGKALGKLRAAIIGAHQREHHGVIGGGRTRATSGGERNAGGRGAGEKCSAVDVTHYAHLCC
jgi:hypothetical protein